MWENVIINFLHLNIQFYKHKIDYDGVEILDTGDIEYKLKIKKSFISIKSILKLTFKFNHQMDIQVLASLNGATKKNILP